MLKKNPLVAGAYLCFALREHEQYTSHPHFFSSWTAQDVEHSLQIQRHVDLIYIIIPYIWGSLTVGLSPLMGLGAYAGGMWTTKSPAKLNEYDVPRENKQKLTNAISLTFSYIDKKTKQNMLVGDASLSGTEDPSEQAWLSNLQMSILMGLCACKI